MASGNPLISQGVLNRLKASVTVPAFPNLNVTASYLNKEGIRLAREGNATTMLPSMVGVVPSPEPYLLVNVTIHLLKTQALSQQYEAQLQKNSLIGSVVVRPDVSSGLSAFDFLQCAIQSVDELDFSGASAGYGVRIQGYYPINSSLFT